MITKNILVIFFLLLKLEQNELEKNKMRRIQHMTLN